MKPFAFFLFIISISNVSAQVNTYQATLRSLCDVLLTTQINSPTDPNFGALVCPSVNPDDHPIHSRSAEAVYPFSVAYKLTNKPEYRDAAIKLGNWLIKNQDLRGEKKGGWSESWPDPQQKGWYGTTTDQLISLAGSYAILKPWLSPAEINEWNYAMTLAADYIVRTFPIGNVNYNPTGAATLLYTYHVTDKPKQIWLLKADSLMNSSTLNQITADNLLHGEGKGVDEGYNIAQSIGYIALYAILKNDLKIKRIAADLLKTHSLFVYPNGSVDNSWGTRSFKWNYESGTKTAPGVYFSFALLADMDPEFEKLGLRCLNYLNTQSLQNGWIGYGPSAINHISTSPPCNYSTFARAQSIALAIEYGSKSKTQRESSLNTQTDSWYKFFPDIKVAVIRTPKMMATVSAYGEIRRYPRESVCRGGSVTNLWYDGFGANGFLQSSSTSVYQRIEEMHMPIETELLPLTPRVEFNQDTNLYSNLFEAEASMDVSKEADHIKVLTIGNMQTIKGSKSDVRYNIINRFYNTHLVKEITLNGTQQNYRIIEPIVKSEGSTFHLKNRRTVIIKSASSKNEWKLKILSSTAPYKIVLGVDEDKYWSPFPGVEAYPITINFTTASDKPQTIKISLGKK
ncbi:hypothetical protein [Pedobacter arcticus]|uniref:hypothetical protein n=1 Tax=Pedobacter arcticus TaxID=752140 RepID=UPI001ED9AB11|nr:hypothetical protein [Pedobacter arcticus]